MLRYYTDGSCRGNGSANSNGGFGVIKLDEKDNLLWQYQDFKAPTTNNEMELKAILVALIDISLYHKDIFPIPTIYTDSAYACNLINKWMYGWAKNNWTKSDNQPIKNLLIIQQIYSLAHLANIEKVKGHSDNKWNNYVDKLATGQIKI